MYAHILNNYFPKHSINVFSLRALFTAELFFGSWQRYRMGELILFLKIFISN